MLKPTEYRSGTKGNGLRGEVQSKQRDVVCCCICYQEKRSPVTCKSERFLSTQTLGYSTGRFKSRSGHDREWLRWPAEIPIGLSVSGTQVRCMRRCAGAYQAAVKVQTVLNVWYIERESCGRRVQLIVDRLQRIEQKLKHSSVRSTFPTAYRPLEESHHIAEAETWFERTQKALLNK